MNQCSGVCNVRIERFVKRLMARGFDQADAEDTARGWLRFLTHFGDE